MTEHSAEYEQVRQAVQPVIDDMENCAQTHDEGHLIEDCVRRAAMLAVVAAQRSEHHRWSVDGPTPCPRCAELAALRKEIEDA